MVLKFNFLDVMATLFMYVCILINDFYRKNNLVYQNKQKCTQQSEQQSVISGFDFINQSNMFYHMFYLFGNEVILTFQFVFLCKKRNHLIGAFSYFLLYIFRRNWCFWWLWLQKFQQVYLWIFLLSQDNSQSRQTKTIDRNNNPNNLQKVINNQIWQTKTIIDQI